MLIYQQKRLKTNMLFHHIQFKKPDPEDNGLLEEIAEERMEPEAITLEDYVNGEELQEKWQEIESDFEKDPEWLRSTEE